MKTVKTPRASRAVISLTSSQAIKLDAEALRHFQWRAKAARLVKILQSRLSDQLTLAEISIAIGSDPSDKLSLVRISAMLAAWGHASAPIRSCAGACA